jgi:hypothetical protein
VESGSRPSPSHPCHSTLRSACRGRTSALLLSPGSSGGSGRVRPPGLGLRDDSRVLRVRGAKDGSYYERPATSLARSSRIARSGTFVSARAGFVSGNVELFVPATGLPGSGARGRGPRRTGRSTCHAPVARAGPLLLRQGPERVRARSGPYRRCGGGARADAGFPSR